MNLLMFENSPSFILKAQKYLTPKDTWYATMNKEQARALIEKGDVDVLMVRRRHEAEFWRALGSHWTEGMPGGRQVIVLPRMGCGFFLRRYLRSQKSPASG